MLSKSFWCVSSLLLLSCNDAPDKVTKEPPSGYSLVSIEYSLIQSTPIRQLATQRECINNLDQPTTYTVNNDQVVLVSYFGNPYEKPQYVDLIRTVEIPLPVIDATNSIIGLSDLKKPFDFKKSSAWAIDTNRSASVDIPAFTTYTVSIYNSGSTLSTQYICTVENDDTKEQLTFTGDWRGTVYYKQEVIFSDENNNIIKGYEHPVLY